MLKIRGNSGCHLELIGNTVYKYPRKLYSKERLYTQFLKQLDFQYKQDIQNDNIKTPFCKWNVDHIEMDFINGHNYIEFCNICSDEEHSHIIDQLINFIRKNETISTELDLDIFQVKFDSIYQKILLPPKIIQLWWKLRNQCKGLTIKGCFCHGDLSLSNLIIDKNRKTIWLIDFLNTFYDCPLQDWCKLKQSTQYHWDLHLYDQFYNKEKVLKRLKEFDQKLDKEFNTKTAEYTLFQYFNLLRLLPYVTDKNIKAKVEKWIISLI